MKMNLWPHMHSAEQSCAGAPEFGSEMTHKAAPGFTLTEILVVIAILGILAALLIVLVR